MSEAPEGRLYGSLVNSLGGLLAVCGSVLLILMWSNVIGPFYFLGLSPDSAERAVGLWVPHADGRGIARATAQGIQAWRQALPAGRAVLTARSLDRLRDQGVEIVVVPDASDLDAAEVGELRGFVGGGGGAIVAGSVGVRDAQGEWRGYTLMREMLEVAEVAPAARDASRYLVAWHRGPLSALLGPGERIPLVAEPGVPAVAEGDAELRWFGGAPQADAGPRGAALRRRIGLGRLVWLAAGPEHARDADGQEWRGMTRLVASTLAWVSRQPVVEVLPWPGAAGFAGEIVAAPGRKGPGDEDLGEWQAFVAAEVARAENEGGLARVRIPRRGPSASERADRHTWARALLARRGAWVAGRGEVTRWMRSQAELRASVQERGPIRLLVNVTNLGETAVHEASLRIHLNRRVQSAVIEGTTILQERAGLRFDAGASAVDVVLPELPPGGTRSYTLDYALFASGA